MKQAKGSWRPLRGVRVLSFEAAFSLPAGTRVLADLGAEVVRAGPPAGGFDAYIAVIDGHGLNKQTIGIDLRAEPGKAIARRLVQVADVVCYNFRPHVMRAFGFDPPALRTLKPDLIVLQLSGFGVPGPWQDYPAYGPSTEAAAGMNALMGGPDDPPMRVGSGVFSDQTGGRYAALAILAALEHRQRTGEGHTLDLSMTEGIAHLLGEQFLAAARTGRNPERTGNRDARHAPQGIYPCAGDDDWLAISIQTDEQWQALRGLIGADALASPSYERAEGRLAQHDAIDDAIAAWTRQHIKEEAATLLQARDILAAPVQKSSDLPFDQQLAARGAFQPVVREAPLLGRMAHPHLTLAWQVEGRPRPALAPERPTGTDNRRVLKRWLGLSAAEVRGLERDGALVCARPAPIRVPANHSGGVVDPAFAEKLGLPAPGEEPRA